MTGQDVAVQSPTQEVVAYVASPGFLTKLESALPENVTPRRFQSVAITAIRQNPELVTADRDSLFNAIVRAGQDGLMPDGRDAALVIFKTRDGKKVQYLPMIGGLRKLAGEFGYSIGAQVVYENDEWDYELGSRPWVKHKPAKLGQERGQMIGAYAVAHDAAGRMFGPEVMAKEEIEAVRAVSRAKDGDLWTKWTAEAWRKTVARRLFKQLPRTVVASDATEQRHARVLQAMDDEFDLGGKPTMTEQQADIAASITQLPPAPEEPVAVREDPGERAADSLLNRIAHLTERVGDGALVTLRGVFGVDTAEALAPADAERYADMLERALPVAEPEPEEAEFTEVEEGEQVSVFEQAARRAQEAQ